MAKPSMNRRVGFFEPLTWRFWLNYAFSLAATCWLALGKMEMQVDGQVVDERPIRIYECYAALFQGNFNPALTQIVLAHLAITFVVAYAVYRSFYVSRKAEAVSASPADE